MIFMISMTRGHPVIAWMKSEFIDKNYYTSFFSLLSEKYRVRMFDVQPVYVMFSLLPNDLHALYIKVGLRGVHDLQLALLATDAHLLYS